MIRSLFVRLLAVTAVAVAASGAQRVSFVRNQPADHELHGDEVTVLYALGDNDQLRTFVDVLVDRLDRIRPIPVVDVTERHNHVVGDHVAEADLLRIRRDHPADTYIGVNRFSCQNTERSGEVSAYDIDNARIKRTLYWVDTVCRTRVDLLDTVTLKRIDSFEVKGEGTSQRVIQIGAEERKIAAMQAARYAAISAAELMTPHVIRESVELEETAPGFDQARDLIESERYSDVRERWERMLGANGSSASLHYNLGVVCEAMGDLEGARQHYEAAQKLSPDQARYRTELSMFRRRSAAKK